MRLAELRVKPDGAAGGLGVGQTAEVLRPLFAARAELPPLPEVYELIAETWASSDATPTRGHLAVLDEGVRLFPRRTELLLRAAELNLRHGFREQAAALLEIATRIATDSFTRERIALLNRRLEVN